MSIEDVDVLIKMIQGVKNFVGKGKFKIITKGLCFEYSKHKVMM
ncbi:hypothetical protein QCI42_22515 [Bacillus fungorum]